ncbi:MAG: amino acid adenylation domain-containing protein, partial [Chroococcidiopsidaceae cyanobacterium CP_BM_ER_R8_30]|nr:amino acid adenylation domain-containing protein [Chroococcidiopsidaceae cyanobacterium CP_BM_ER_R8_30]
RWQTEMLASEEGERLWTYWQKQLAGELPVLNLPTDRPRPPVQTYRSASHAFKLSEELTRQLQALAKTEEATLYMTLLAAFQVLLYRYTGQEDILVGSPTTGRDQVETEGMTGFFVNNLLLRTDLSDNPSFLELLVRVREVALSAYAHQDLPFEQLVEELQPERDLGRTPLFQVMFVLRNDPMPTVELSSLSLKPLMVETQTAKFDLTLFVGETDQGLAAAFEYNTDLFDSSTIERMLGHFQTLLEGIVAHPEQSIATLPLLSPAEQQQLLVEWNDTQRDYLQDACIHQLFEAQVQQTPDAVAVVFEDEQLTYRELNARANQLAHYLQALGVGPEVLVGICVERSLLMVVGLLAILKAGGAYVPLDPSYPQERLSFMLEDTQTRVLLTQQHLLKGLPQHSAQVVCIDAEWKLIAQEKQENPQCRITTENLAYVMYTSGSTGKPKGVSVIHRGVVRLVQQSDYVNLSANEIFLQLAPFSFDAATFEIWGSLLHGARLVIFPTHTPSLAELGQVLQQYQITTLWLTAGLFHLMVDERLEDLKPVRQLLAGGDVLSVPHVQKVLQNLGECKLINGYGPTEGTTFTCCYSMTELTQVGTCIPIGRPIANTQVYVLDRYLQPVPIGVPGELYIGGDGLARGYLNRPELTTQKFIPHPFSHEPGGRLYKTGDLVRYLPDGNIEFLGRMDHQVKIRGFRIEPGEIEAVLSQHATVRDTVVLAREDIPGNKQLVAYVVLHKGEASTPSELRRCLKERLPEYMVPSAFVMLETLPLTPNGKVDRQALPAPDQTNSISILERTFLAPRDSIELQLTRIWQEILGTRSIGVRDNFFDLGGHSLIAVSLFEKIKKIFGKNLPLAILFQAPTVAQLASILHQEECSALWSSLVAIQTGGSLPPLFCIHPAFGDVVIYYKLASYLGSNQPVYGLQPQGLDGKQVPQSRIEDMAADYIREVRTVQPQGPYLLAGWSMGGLVAFEMAQQLYAQGQKVAMLALFDTQAPQGLKGKPLLVRVSRHLTNFSRLGPKQKLTYLQTYLQKAHRFFWVNKPALQEAHKRAAHSYVPQVYQGKAILFRANDQPEEMFWVDSALGWGSLVAGGLEIQLVPGYHNTLMKEPYVPILAERLKACLDVVCKER